MNNWKSQVFWLHVLGLVVPAILAALTKSDVKELVAIGQGGAAIYGVVQALFHSTPPASPSAPAAVDTGMRLPPPELK